METRSNQILVGSVVLGLIAALVVFIVWLSQIGEGGEKTYDIFFQQSVEGLANGTGVTFRGVPVGHGSGLGPPRQDVDMIFLYRAPLLNYWCETGEPLDDIVRNTLIHEIGHHFGYSDDDMDRIEFGE